MSVQPGRVRRKLLFAFPPVTDRGEGSVSHLGVIIIIALVSGVLVATGLPAQIADRVDTVVCQVTSGNCEPVRATGNAGSSHTATQTSTREPGRPGELQNLRAPGAYDSARAPATLAAPGAPLTPTAPPVADPEPPEGEGYWSCGWFGQTACDMVQGFGRSTADATTGAVQSTCMIHLCSHSGFKNTWKNTYDGVQNLVTDPAGSLKSMWNDSTEDIHKDWKAGHKASAITRTIPTIVGSIFGGKGLHSLHRLGKAKKAEKATEKSNTAAKREAAQEREAARQREAVERGDIDASGRLVRVPPPRVDGPTHPTIPILDVYRNEGNPRRRSGKSHIQYLSAAEREAFRIVVYDGRFYRSNGELFDTSSGRAFRGKGKAIWVMDEYGNLYASTYAKPGKFHHSSFLAGGPVAGAGELKIVNGKLLSIDNHSGHYKPPARTLDEVVNTLRGAGAQLGEMRVKYARKS